MKIKVLSCFIKFNHSCLLGEFVLLGESEGSLESVTRLMSPGVFSVSSITTLPRLSLHTKHLSST